MSEGERINAFHIEAAPSSYGARMVPVHLGQAVGHKRICLFPPVRTGKVRVVLDDVLPGARLKGVALLEYRPD